MLKGESKSFSNGSFVYFSSNNAFSTGMHQSTPRESSLMLMPPSACGAKDKARGTKGQRDRYAGLGSFIMLFFVIEARGTSESTREAVLGLRLLAGACGTCVQHCICQGARVARLPSCAGCCSEVVVGRLA